jgi:hypothetical protein
LQTFERFADDVLSIKIAGESEPIGVTSEHPFFARNNLSSEDDGEWRKAGELNVGDEILKSDGTWAKVENVVSRSNDKVYNFEVTRNHNYFVGQQGLLVHNACNTHGHHSDPKFMGGEPKQPLTNLPDTVHRDLHSDLNKFLRNRTDGAGNDMAPRRGNSGKKIQETFSRDERLNALRDFYNQNMNKYPDAARDFFNQHP